MGLKKDFNLVAGVYQHATEPRWVWKRRSDVEPKRRFQVTAQSIHDNLSAGKIGYVRDEYGAFYKIDREHRAAFPVDGIQDQALKAVFETTWLESQATITHWDRSKPPCKTPSN